MPSQLRVPAVTPAWRHAPRPMPTVPDRLICTPPSTACLSLPGRGVELGQLSPYRPQPSDFAGLARLRSTQGNPYLDEAREPLTDGRRHVCLVVGRGHPSATPFSTTAPPTSLDSFILWAWAKGHHVSIPSRLLLPSEQNTNDIPGILHVRGGRSGTLGTVPSLTSTYFPSLHKSIYMYFKFDALFVPAASRAHLTTP